MNVLISGGAGKQYSSDIVSYFLQKNCNVSVLTRSREAAEDRLYSKFPHFRPQINCIEVDYTDLSSLEDAVEEAFAKFQGIDCLINSAATAKISTVEDFDLESWNKVFHLNLTVPVFLSKTCFPYLSKSDNGSILNISSIYGEKSPRHYIYEDSGLNSPINYGASKASLQYVTKYLAAYWAPKIRVNCLVPGGFYNNQPDNFVKNYVRNVPLGRMAEVGDLGGAAFFLCSTDAKYITGQCLSVDGGWSIW